MTKHVHECDLCFVMAKESLPFAKYPSLLELEARHGTDLGFEYSTPDSAKAFTSYIAQAQRKAFLKSLAIRKCFFYSIMIDVHPSIYNFRSNWHVVRHLSDHHQKL